MSKVKYKLDSTESVLFFAKAAFKSTYQLEVVETPEQYRTLLRLRREIFVNKEGYPWRAALNGYERVSVHMLAKKDGQYVGMISVKLDDVHGLPLDKFVKPFRRRELRIAEFDKFGVIDEKAHKTAFYELISAAYALVRFCGYNALVIFTLKRKNDNVRLYRKIGFEIRQDFILFEDQLAVMMMLELDKTNGLMWKTEQLVKAAKRVLSCVNRSEM